MSETTLAAPTHLRVLVPDETVQLEEQPETQLQPGDVEEQGLLRTIRRWIVKDKELPLDEVRTEMKRVEQEVDGLIASLRPATAGGYQLQQVQVSVGISAQGSIAVVTAGVQASLTLVYSRP